MTLQSSGPISLNDIAAELGISSAGLSLLDSRLLALAGKSGPPVSISDFYGKSAVAPLSASCPDVNASRATNNTGLVSGSTSVSVSGGVAPYSFSWVKNSGTGNFGAVAINSSTTQNPTFTRSAAAPGSGAAGTYTCTINDSSSRSTTVTINVELDGYPF
jgi:hypothetical protein